MKTKCFAVLGAALTIAACGGSSASPPPDRPEPADEREPVAKAPKSLFVRLGGKPAIEAVVGEFVARLAADPRVKFRFANSDVPALTADLVDFVCAAAGGSCEYKGREMGVLHASMQITEEEWNATVEALVGALDKFKVGLAEKHEVLGAIGSTKQAIVAPPAEQPSREELARIEEASRDLGRYGKRADFMKAAFTALRHGQRSYADQLFSIVEAWLGADKVADVAPLFRTGAPPRITTPVVQLPADSAPQPKGAVGGSEEDEKIPPRPKASLTGTLQLDAKDGEAFGVVMLTPVEGKGRRRTAKHRVIEQRGREFAPRLMAVPVGSTVAFPNFDPIYHNVFSRSEARPFDLGIFKNGQSREVSFPREGIVRIGCNLHANMSTSIIIVAAPHYAVTDAAGKFHFRSLKPGAYTLRAWTERSAEPVSKRIEVAEGANQVEVDAEGGVAPGPGQDKFGAPRGASL
jgi:hemoglobin